MTYSENDLVYFLFPNDDGFRIHVTVDISPTYTTEVTQNATEENSDINDNARNTPLTLTLTQFMSELVGQEELEQYDPYFVGDHIKLHERLLLARQNKEVLAIDCGPEKGIFGNMLITSYTPNWSSGGDGKSLNYTLNLQQIDYAATKTRNLAAEQAVKEHNAAFKDRQKNGRQPTRPGIERISDAKRSIIDMKTLTTNKFRGI